MIKLFFLLPVLMCSIWAWYLNQHGYSVKSGLNGFLYIIAFNLVIILFFVTMIWVTH